MVSNQETRSLVTTEWLQQNLTQPDLRIVDATYYLPMQGKNAREEYNERHIPGAVFFDIDELSDETSPLPHMLAPPAKFASRMRRLGLGDDQSGVLLGEEALGNDHE